MNPSINQGQANAAVCCPVSCQVTYQVNGQEIVNTYQCNRRPFSISDMWNIQRNKKEVSRTVGLV